MVKCILQVREKGRMRVHHINNVNRVLDVLERQYNVSKQISLLRGVNSVKIGR